MYIIILAISMYMVYFFCRRKNIDARRMLSYLVFVMLLVSLVNEYNYLTNYDHFKSKQPYIARTADISISVKKGADLVISHQLMLDQRSSRKNKDQVLVYHFAEAGEIEDLRVVVNGKLWYRSDSGAYNSYKLSKNHDLYTITLHPSAGTSRLRVTLNYTSYNSLTQYGGAAVYYGKIFNDSGSVDYQKVKGRISLDFADLGETARHSVAASSNRLYTQSITDSGTNSQIEFRAGGYKSYDVPVFDLFAEISGRSRSRRSISEVIDGLDEGDHGLVEEQKQFTGSLYEIKLQMDMPVSLFTSPQNIEYSDKNYKRKFYELKSASDESNKQFEFLRWFHYYISMAAKGSFKYSLLFSVPLMVIFVLLMQRKQRLEEEAKKMEKFYREMDQLRRQKAEQAGSLPAADSNISEISMAIDASANKDRFGDY